MTVVELLEKLVELDDDAVVYFHTGEGHAVMVGDAYTARLVGHNQIRRTDASGLFLVAVIEGQREVVLSSLPDGAKFVYKGVEWQKTPSSTLDGGGIFCHHKNSRVMAEFPSDLVVEPTNSPAGP